MTRFLLAAALATAFAGAASAATYRIDPRHTQVFFTYTHHGYANLTGRLNEAKGEVVYDAAKPAASSVTVELPMSSLSTGVPGLDKHLASPDFFDVEQFPTITFRSTLVRALADATWEVMGDLTVHGVTRPVILQVDFDGADVSPFGDERIGFSAATEVDREDFGLTWNVALETGGLLVGKTARIELAVQAVAPSRAAVA